MEIEDLACREGCLKMGGGFMGFLTKIRKFKKAVMCQRIGNENREFC